MLQGEKEKLLTLFADPRHWCRNAEARDEAGHAVHYDDPAASAWDITGGICFLFGWQRALELFPQLERHINEEKHARRWIRDNGIASMAALQDANDDDGTTFEMIREWLASMPIWTEHRQPS